MPNDVRRGVTLVELLVTIAVVSIIATVVVLAIPRAPASVDDLPTRIARARTEAIDSAHAVSFSLIVSGRAMDVTAHPDGSVLVDSIAHADRFTGRPRDGQR